MQAKSKEPTAKKEDEHSGEKAEQEMAFSLDALLELNAKALDAVLYNIRALKGGTLRGDDDKQLKWAVARKQKRGSPTLFEWHYADNGEPKYIHTLDSDEMDTHLRAHIIRTAYESFVFLNSATAVYKPIGADYSTKYFTNETGAFLKGEMSQLGVVNYKKLCNFTAKITNEVVRSTDKATTRTYQIRGMLEESDTYKNRELHTIDVEVVKFPEMKWVAEKWGSRPIIHSGQATRDEVREAIQHYSGDVPQELRYTHTGWIKRGTKWYFLTYSGALGADGLDNSVLLDIGIEELKQYTLPAPDASTLIDDIKALLDLIDTLSRATVTYPLVSTVFRTALCECEPIGYTLYYVGHTGNWKSTLVALALSFVGPHFTQKTLPSVKAGTPNAIELTQHTLKDLPIVFDDFAPIGDRGTDAKLRAKQDAFVRGQSDGQSRYRLNRAAEFMPEYTPRGSAYATGEDVPDVLSAIARTLISRLTKGDIQQAVLEHAQIDAKKGRWSRIMASYIQWLAPQMDSLNESIPTLHDTLLRDEDFSQLVKGDDLHRRVAASLVSMYVGFDMFMHFAVDKGAITEADADARRTVCKTTLFEFAREQAPYLESSDPLKTVIEMTQTALLTGKAYVADHNDEPLTSADRHAWGYIDNENPPKNAMKIGWLGETIVASRDGQPTTRRELWLARGAWETVLNQIASQRNKTLQYHFDELLRQMREEGYIDISTERKGETRKRIGGVGQQRVLIMDASHIVTPPEDKTGEEKERQFRDGALMFFLHYGEHYGDPVRPTSQQLQDQFLDSPVCSDGESSRLELRPKLDELLENDADVKTAFDHAMKYGMPTRRS